MKIKKEEYKTNKISRILMIILLTLILFITILKIIPSSKKAIKQTNINSNIKNNINQNITKDKNINGISFTNIKYSYNKNISLITYTITNHTKNIINLGIYEIIIKDKSNNILAIIAPNIDHNINPEESYNTSNAISNIDINKAYSMNIILNNK